MHDLSAVAGVVGEDLKKIEGYARESAKAFGTDAGVAVEGYKLLLSQLSPELGKFPEALQAMGKSIQVTSKLMGNDGVAAAEVLTTAMNQYGVSLDDPMEASRKMAEMMNVMAAAGQEGSAELPAIKVALEQCGMAAKAANVSFEETNAAIQVLDKAGKKGSEGGVALRNTLAILGQGRFLPKQTQEELAAAGIDVLKLADTSLSLKDRLDMLKPVLNDAALFSKLFGMENANAARALVQGSDELGRLTTAITGTASAEEQAAIVMDSYAERQARINQKMEDFKISLFQSTGDLTLWAGVVMEAAMPISQLMPLIMGVGKSISWVKGLQWASMWTGLSGTLTTFATRAAGGFRLFSTIAVTACRTVGVAVMNIPIIGWIAAAVAGLIALGTYLWNNSETFRAVLFGIWEVVKAVVAPVWDFIVGGVQRAWTSVKAFATYLWDILSSVFSKIWTWGERFFSFLRSIPQRIKNAVASALGFVQSISGSAYEWLRDKVFKPIIGFFTGLYEKYVRPVLDKIVGLMGKVFNPIIELWNKLTGKVVATFKIGYEKGSENFRKDKEGEEEESSTPDGSKPEALGIVPPVSPLATNPTGSTLSTATSGVSSEGKAARNITVNVERLVERFEIHTTNLQGDLSRVKDMVGEALLSALNDVNLA